MKTNSKQSKFIKTLILGAVFSLLVPSSALALVGDMTTYTGTGLSPQNIAFDGTNMWTINSKNATRITPSGVMTNYSLGSWPSTYGAKGIAFSGTHIWTASRAVGAGVGYGGATKLLISTGATTFYGYPATTNRYPVALAFDGANSTKPWIITNVNGNTWTAFFNQTAVVKTSPTGVMTSYTIPTGGAGFFPSDIAFDGTNMWTANGWTCVMYYCTLSGGSKTVTKVTPSGGTTIYNTGVGVSGIAFDGTNMWAANYPTNGVTKITPTGGMTTYTGTGAAPVDIAFDGTNMWMANNVDSSVTRVSPSGVMTRYTGTGGNPVSIAFDGTYMWTANGAGNSVTKIVVIPTGTVTVSSNIASSWTITGPETISGSGTSQTSTSKKTGTYTITWGAVSGYTTPSTQSLSLSDGATITFSGNYVVTNTAPAAPTISGPVTTTTGTAQTYSFVATDPQGNQIRYGIDWDMNGVADEWLPSGVAYVNSGTSRSTTHSWATTGTKTFRALAQDIHGLNSSWSATYTVTVTSPNTAPTAPTVSGPVTTPINTVQTYSFVATDPESNQIRYGVDWDMNGVADVWVPAGVTYVNSGTSRSATYSWTTSGAKTFQVLAQDTFGLNSPWRTYNVTVTVPTCANGTNNYPTCTQCPDNQAYLLTNCVDCSGTGGCTGVPGGTVSDPTGGLVCNNGALTPAYCSDCAEGMYYTGSSCIACSNGGCSGSGVTLVCNNGSIDPPACITPAPPTCNSDSVCGAGETIQNCSQDCNPRYEQF